jgi:hypothetical protein
MNSSANKEHIMKKIIKLIQNSDFSIETQTSFYNRIADISRAIAMCKKHYTEGKKLLTEADARLIRAIVEDDYEAKQVAEDAIIRIVNGLRETREHIKQLTIRNMSWHKMLMNHQMPATKLQDVGDLVGLPKFPEETKEEAKQPSEHIYVLPRQQVFELLKALTEGIKAQPDFKALEIAISTGFLKK